MRKTPSLFKRDYDGTREIYDELVEQSAWVQRGEGEATLKIDGTCCMIEGGELFKRYDRKLTKQALRRKKRGHTGPWGESDFKPAPRGWRGCHEQPDTRSGHWPGWVPVTDGPEDRWHREALARLDATHTEDGTYELIGPKIQGNPYDLSAHELVRHGATKLDDVPTDFDGLRAWLEANNVEGIVWWHPDGRKAKIKRRDFGLHWP